MDDPKSSTRKRFWEKVDKKGPDDCWNWKPPCSGEGYGMIYDSFSRKEIGAHRYSYEIHCGPIPDGMFVCHHCDNKKCCNPSHFFLGTNQDNILDAAKKGIIGGPRPAIQGENHYGAKLRKEQVEEIRLMLSNGVKMEVIAENFFVSRSTISSIKTGRTWFSPAVSPSKKRYRSLRDIAINNNMPTEAEQTRSPNLGENNPQSKLKEKKVKEIKRMLADGYSLSHIAKRFSVSRAAITDIKMGRTWSHVVLEGEAVTGMVDNDIRQQLFEERL